VSHQRQVEEPVSELVPERRDDATRWLWLGVIVGVSFVLLWQFRF
jgi:hypothetical protein